MYGGGTFLTQNKILPGTYINYVSVAKASSVVSDRGVAAMAINMDWGPVGKIFKVEQEDFQTTPEKYFGHAYTDDEMKGLRDLFLNLKTGYFFRLNGGGASAECDYCTAKYGGTAGNKIMVVIYANADDTGKWDVETYFDGTLMDIQTGVATLAELKDNDFVTWKDDGAIAETAGTDLTGGTNGSAATGTTHSTFLGLLESYSFNILGCLSTDATVKSLYYTYVKRMRDDEGAKFQVVLYDFSNADYEGCINVCTPSTDSVFGESALVYWVTGAEANCAVNANIGNNIYDGEFGMTVKTKQSDLKAQLAKGQLVFHSVNGGDYKVMSDINSFTSFTNQKKSDFGSNQAIRVLDQIGNDCALMFAKTYMNIEDNDTPGRTALWNDLCDYSKKLQTLRAIQNFDTADITVERGETAKDVLVSYYVEPTLAMEKMYMYVYVRE